jgi:hypothetical protein
MVIALTQVSNLTLKILIGSATFLLLKVVPRIFTWWFPNAIIKLSDEKPLWIIRWLQLGGNWILISLLSILSIVVTAQYQNIANWIISLLPYQK